MGPHAQGHLGDRINQDIHIRTTGDLSGEKGQV
jgi:hypothetical protein